MPPFDFSQVSNCAMICSAEIRLTTRPLRAQHHGKADNDHSWDATLAQPQRRKNLIMKQIRRLTFIGMSFLALLTAVPSIKAETEDDLIAKFSSPDEGKVLSAMTHYKKLYRDSTKAFPVLKSLLTDSRQKVRERAAGMLGAMHADVNEQDVKAICALLKEPNVGANQEGLKSLRGLQGPAVAGAVPDILPCLKNSNSYVVRDACRTLAVLGNKDVIPLIEPLLNSPESKVKKDAQDAITALRSKS